MRLMCPLCGGETEVPGEESFACQSCGRYVRREANGKAFLLVPGNDPGARTDALPPEAAKLLRKAEKAEPEKRHDLLMQALALAPDSMEVNKALLYLGRLWQRNPRQMDYHVIKSYLLHVFDDPASEGRAQCTAMLDELTADPQLTRCLALAPVPSAFLREYLDRLCGEYVEVFLKGSTSVTGTIMGFRFRRIEVSVAPHVARMIRNAQLTDLPAPFDTMIPEALKSAFIRHVGEEKFLTAELEK